MTASVPIHASFDRPWTSRAGPYMTMPFINILAHVLFPFDLSGLIEIDQ